MNQPTDQRRVAPATARNRMPILDILQRALPPTGTVLEIASGTGEHAIWFARHLTHLAWQPSDCSVDALASIAAWRVAEGTGNLLPPILLDASSPAWPLDRATAIVAINMIHISPWAATLGLMAGAGRLLPSGGLLYTYGPYRCADYPLAASNAAFDADLRGRNPEWGLRDVAEVAAAAQANGLGLCETIEMPANNLSLLFRRL